MSSATLDKSYEPARVEERWYRYWEENDLFHADPESGKPPYSIVIPPPNVTGELHIGHALDNTLQDSLCRFKRLRGFEVLWMPGTDHAGIATQNVVERQLAAEGLSRHDLGREKFIERVWEWRREYGGRIINQLKRLGASCDWKRERFTMDEGLSRAVREVFVRLYEEGLIYRGDYIINWCPRCHTALSDLESEHEEVKGGLYHIRYPFKNGKGYLVVATTRPETLLGDTAVAVNPDDPRYQDLADDTVLLPLLGRELPIIRDAYVSTEFGTGALKITPAHDPNDFEIGRKHNLPSVKMMDDDGRVNQEGGAYAGLDRFKARERVLADLKAQGLLEKQEEYLHSVGHCYRCRTMVEPILSKQWFVKVGPLAEKALKAVQTGETKIVPELWTKTYYDWMTGIRDWCISRQIWWGHRIPAWYCDCGEVVVSREDPSQCPACGGELRRETDVLDTWFSSGLWPFSTMGWPDQTPELAKFYPTSCLVTGFDILFFWVARMMMMGIKFMGEVPFKDVCIHALVRDQDGRKMSKSKGNVMDPLILMEQYGTDAFRFTLMAFAAQGRDIKMSEERIAGYRNFVNKLWNAARFTLMNLDGDQEAGADLEPLLEDRWIMSRVRRTAAEAARAMDEYRFNDAAGALYRFVWHEFCDWYLELVKAPLYNHDDPKRQAAARRVLGEVFSRVLVMLHPFMPFVTEELWQKLTDGRQGSIMTATWPQEAPEAADAQAEEDMELVMAVIGAVRNIRGEMGVKPGQKVPLVLAPHDEKAAELLRGQADRIMSQARASELTWAAEGEQPEKAAGAALNRVTLFVPLAGLVDFSEEERRLNKEIAKIEKTLIASQRKLSNEGFLAKAPEAVVQKQKAKAAEAQSKLDRLRGNLERIRSFL